MDSAIPPFSIDFMTPRLARLNTRLQKHRSAILWTIVLLATLFRVIYFFQISGGPHALGHHWDQSDMGFFHRSALLISQGDLLLNRPWHPDGHIWQQMVVADFSQKYPREAARYQQVAQELKDGTTASYLMWTDWLGGKRFYQEPLYTYFLAAVYGIFGPNVHMVFVIQMILGIFTNVLVYLVTRRCFGDLTAVIAAGISLFYAPLLFYELVLLRTSFNIFATIGLVYLALVVLERNSPLYWLSMGLACGLAIILKSTFGLFVVALSLHILWWQYHHRQWMLKAWALLITGVAISFSPVVLRNILVDTTPWEFASTGQLGIIFANAQDTPNDLATFGFGIRFYTDIMSKVGTNPVATLLATINTHLTPGHYLLFLCKKFLHLWHWYEIPNNVNFYYYQLQASVLYWLPFRFLFVAPCGLVGMILWRKHLLQQWPLSFMVLINILLLTMFYHVSRLRIVIIPPLIPFCAYTVFFLLNACGTQEWGRLIFTIAVIALLMLGMATALPPRQEQIRMADYLVTLKNYGTLVQKAVDQEHWNRAADLLQQAVDTAPPVIHRLNGSRKVINETEFRFAQAYAEVYIAQARVSRRLSKSALAKQQRKKAAVLREALSLGEAPRGILTP